MNYKMDSGSGFGAARLGDDVGDGVLERNIREEGTVELNIRSPVSSVEDLRIICPLDYRVDRLKEMISQQFPGNPKPQNQKLVYAGKLLEDGFRLNQFLRFEDECPVFTIHLVCRILQSESREPELRRRRVEKTSEELETEPLPALYQDGVNSWVQYLSSQNQYTEDHLQQMVVMQELYTQYLSQYMQYMQTTTPVIQPEIQGGPNERERRDIGAAPAIMNAGGGAQGFQEAEEEGGNRDMLDWLYVSIRILILVSIVYFYSSLARFIIVAIIFVVLFSLQGGIWNWARGDRDHIHNEVNNIRGEDGEARREDPGHREPQGEDGELRVENELEIRPPEPNLLLIVGDFVVSFFSSMIPDTNQPIA